MFCVAVCLLHSRFMTVSSGTAGKHIWGKRGVYQKGEGIFTQFSRMEWLETDILLPVPCGPLSPWQRSLRRGPPFFSCCSGMQILQRYVALDLQHCWGLRIAWFSRILLFVLLASLFIGAPPTHFQVHFVTKTHRHSLSHSRNPQEDCWFMYLCIFELLCSRCFMFVLLTGAVGDCALIAPGDVCISICTLL